MAPPPVPPRVEAAAKLVWLFIAVAALNALRRGELGDWAASKFLNRGADAPEGTVTLAQVIAGGGAAGLGAIQGAAAGAAIGAAIGNSSTDGLLSGSFDPAAELVTYKGTQINRAFLARWQPLVELAASQGIDLRGTAYRNSARQWQLRVAHCPDPVNSPSSDCSPPTAKVGTSRHERGLAIDVVGSNGRAITRSSPEYRFLQTYAARYGVKNLPSEAWHWSIDGG